jgi:hypothetical protein
VLSCTVAQAVSKRLPTAADRVRSPIMLSGICVGYSSTRGISFTTQVSVVNSLFFIDNLRLSKRHGGAVGIGTG